VILLRGFRSLRIAAEAPQNQPSTVLRWRRRDWRSLVEVWITAPSADPQIRGHGRRRDCQRCAGQPRR